MGERIARGPVLFSRASICPARSSMDTPMPSPDGKRPLRSEGGSRTEKMTQIAIITVSERASRGEYQDLGGPAIERWLRRVVASPCVFIRRIVPDGVESVRNVLIELCDQCGVDLILTTGGTGPSPRDLTQRQCSKSSPRNFPVLANSCGRPACGKSAQPFFHVRLRESAAIR